MSARSPRRRGGFTPRCQHSLPLSFPFPFPSSLLSLPFQSSLPFPSPILLTLARLEADRRDSSSLLSDRGKLVTFSLHCPWNGVAGKGRAR